MGACPESGVRSARRSVHEAVLRQADVGQHGGGFFVIVAVTARRSRRSCAYGWSTYRTSDFLDLSEGPKIETDFGVGIEKFTSFRPLLEGMSSARNAQFSPAPDFLTLQFVDSIFGDARFSGFVRKGGEFDIERWIDREQPTGAQQLTRGLVGSIYLSDNIGAIALLASRQKLPVEKGSFDVIWARGAGTAWGASPDLPTAISTMRNSLRGEGSERSIISTLLDIHGTDSGIMRKFRHLFERGRSMRARNMPRSLEFVKAGATLAFTVRVGISTGAMLAIGFATTDTRLIERFEKAVELERRLAKSSRLWDPKVTNTPAHEES
jgi:hypothetical protein